MISSKNRPQYHELEIENRDLKAKIKVLLEAMETLRLAAAKDIAAIEEELNKRNRAGE